ncbi:tetratricopeptide repeat protein [Arenimonas sp.]|uniref:tetratricopeptide repeat protein n=1 Tax=Arenimonas sp. TaxID=1872635 RepID=UPI0039E52C1C
MNSPTAGDAARRFVWLPHCLLLLAIAATWLNALQTPFQFDDWWAVQGNPSVANLVAWWDALPGIRPLLKLSYALNSMLSPHAWGFHLFNLLVHAINALLLHALARRWLAALAPGLTGREFAALATALLFALHPATTEAVTYVSGRSVSLMACFALASLLTLTPDTTDPTVRPQPWWSALLFAIALAVRETAIVMPAAWLLFAWCAGFRLRDSLFALRGHGIVIVLALIAVAATPGYHSFFAWSLDTRSFEEQLLGQVQAHAYLFGHTVLGLQTNIDPDVRVPAQWTMPLALKALLLSTAVVVAAWQRRRRPWLCFALGWYFLQLLPTNSLLPRFDLANDRHVYLALIGPVFAVAVVLFGGRGRFIATLGLAALALLFGTMTVLRNHEYRSELALWQATVSASPAKARPRVNLGVAYELAGDEAGAKRAYLCALHLDPENQQARNNLAVTVSGDITPSQRDCSPP